MSETPQEGSDGLIKATEEIPLSQSEYRPTPYEVSEWEVIGERCEFENFAPLEISVLQSDAAKQDMFEMFEEPQFAGKESAYHGTVPLHATREEMEAQIDTIIADLTAKHQVEIARVAEEMRQKGLEEGEVRIVEHYSKLSDRLKEISDRVEKGWQKFTEEQEKKAYQLALRMAEKIVHTTVEIQPEYIIGVVKAGIEALGASKPLRIRVSPQDFEFMKIVGLPPELGEKELGAIYVADDNIKGGCIIESSFGEVDMVIDRMWKDLHSKLQGGGS
jgi:flagellar assembly protein FliH